MQVAEEVAELESPHSVAAVDKAPESSLAAADQTAAAAASQVVSPTRAGIASLQVAVVESVSRSLVPVVRRKISAAADVLDAGPVHIARDRCFQTKPLDGQVAAQGGTFAAFLAVALQTDSASGGSRSSSTASSATSTLESVLALHRLSLRTSGFSNFSLFLCINSVKL